MIGFVLLLIGKDQTEHRAAMITHFYISSTIILVLRCSKELDKGREWGDFGPMDDEDMLFCWRLSIWTYTCGMLSAIWIRGGVEALKREAKAVPGNLWLCMYE